MRNEISMASAADEERLLLSIDEAARRLSIGRSHLYQLLQQGSLRSVWIGRSRRIATGDLHALVEQLLDDSSDTSGTGGGLAEIGRVKRVPERPRRR